jgi:hypothetical protein
MCQGGGTSLSDGRSWKKENAMEIGFFISALILLTALIYGSLTYRYRDRRKSKVADQIVRDRYEHNQT